MATLSADRTLGRRGRTSARRQRSREHTAPPVTQAPLRLVACLVGLVSLAVYVGTLYPSVAGGDAGELTAVAASGGIAHPPGYPLYTMLARAFALLPVGSVAWRVNLLSAVGAAGAAGLLTATVGRWTGSTAAALFSGGLFAFAPLTWTSAGSAEVFSLHACFVIALVALALRWSETYRPDIAIAGAFVGGLGLSHHHTLVFLVAPLALLVLWSGWPHWRGRDIAKMTLAAILGLAPYLYLPLAATQHPEIAWGDLTTLSGFLAHLTRADYGSFQLATDDVGAPGVFWAQLGYYALSALRNLLGVGAPLAVWGAISGWRERQPLAGMLVMSWLFYVLAFHALANLPVHEPLFRGVTSRFWLQPDLLLLVLAGRGFAQAEALLGKHGTRAGLALAVGLSVVQLGLQWGTHDQHDNLYFHTYGRAVLEPLPERTLLLTQGDLITNTTRYVHVGESLRRDIVVLDQEMMTKPWYVAAQARRHPDIVFPGRLYDPREADGFSMAMFLDANRARRPIFVYPELKAGDPSTSGRYELWPEGFAARVLPAAEPPPIDAWMATAEGAWGRIAKEPWPDWRHFGPETWERVVAIDVWHARHQIGLRALTFALTNGAPAPLLELAARSFDEAIRAQPEPPPYMFKNLGIAEQGLLRYDPAHATRAVRAWKHYLAVGPSDDPERGAIAEAVRQLEATAGR